MKKLIGTFVLLVGLCGAQTHWIATWGAAPTPGNETLAFSDQTLREFLRASLGGDTVRLRLSNAFSAKAVKIGAAHIGLRDSGPAILAGSDRALTFGGQASLEIPPGAVLLSDPVKLTVPAGAELAVSLFVAGQAIAGGLHGSSLETSYLAEGNSAAATSLPDPKKQVLWAFVTGVDVLAPQTASTIIAFGDSITDGARSTVDANHRWPDFLAARLHARKSPLAVVDMGIGGNRVLNDGAVAKSPRSGVNALARFDEDVLAVPGAKYLIVLEGINDIGHIGPNGKPQEQVTADDIIAGHKQMIERAHEHGIKAIGATLTPFDGEAQSSRGYFSPEKEKIRAAVNDWIRNGKGYDAVIDFDKAVRDPANPNKILPAYDSGDSLHPGDAGYEAMAKAIDLSIFTKGAPLSKWEATWAASPSLPIAETEQMRTRKLEFDNQTVREIIHASAGGNSARVTLSNVFGTEPLKIGAAHIALSAGTSAIRAGSDHALTFGGRMSITIPAGAMMLSDPVTLKIPALANLAVSIYLPDKGIASTVHYSAQQKNYAGTGDLTGAADMGDAAVPITSWVYLASVDVINPGSGGTVVAFGDSITDGARSTVDANKRWPDFLAARLPRFAVTDAGVGGNRILHDAARNITYGPSALDRFDRDVLMQAGVKYVLMLEGINDIGHPGGIAPISEAVSAEDMIGGLKQIIERAHERGVKVIGATITPFNGSGDKERTRLAVNEWIRTGKAFDGIVDFDKALRNPENPGQIQAAYDSGDHLHPGDVGYKAMGDAIDLSLFR